LSVFAQRLSNRQATFGWTLDRVWAIEVKSGRTVRGQGMAAFRRAHPRSIPVIVGAGSVTLEEFFAAEPAAWLQSLR